MAVSDYPIRTQEYDVDGTRTGTHLFYPAVPYHTSDDGGNRFYWKGGPQSRVYLDIYKNISTNIELIKRDDDGSIWTNFDNKGVNEIPFYGGYGLVDGNIIANPEIGSPMNGSVVKTGSNNEYAVRFSPYFKRREDILDDDSEVLNSLSYVERSKIVSSASTDVIRVQLDVDFSNNFPFLASALAAENLTTENYAPFSLLKWSISIDDKWLTLSGDWADVEVVNQSFLEKDQSFSLDKEFSMPASAITEKNLVFRVYGITLTENLYYGDLNTTVPPIPTEDLVTGTFIPVAANSPSTGLASFSMDYYQLKDGTLDDSPTFIRPDDYDGTNNKRYWERFYKSPAFLSSILAGNGTVKTSEETFIKKMNISFLPAGNVPPDEDKDSNVGSDRNNKSLSFDLKFFDLEANFNNEDDVYLNWLKYSDGTPTRNWVETSPDLVTPTPTLSIQGHVLKFITESVKVPRAKINGAIVLRDSESNPIEGMTPKKVLVDESENFKMRFLNGMKAQNAKGEYKGEALEIGSKDSEDPTGGDTGLTAFSDGFDNTSFS